MAFDTVNCDEELIERKEAFMKNMRQQMNIDETERIYFPIVFYKGRYVEDYFTLIEEITDEF